MPRFSESPLVGLPVSTNVYLQDALNPQLGASSLWTNSSDTARTGVF